MEIRLDIQGADDVTAREISAVSGAVLAALQRAPAIESVRQAPAPGPEGAKGIGSALGGLLLHLPGEAISGALDIVKAVLSRPGTPPVTIKITRDSAEVTFDPGRITPDQLAALAERLRPPGP
jgi:hypothetical protein